ncbi:UNVERIFIED_CONTAM: hypothetical protein Sindi_2886100 [Sesamum indicum]
MIDESTVPVWMTEASGRQTRLKVYVSRKVVFLEKDFPVDSQRDEMLLGETTETPRQSERRSFEPIVTTDSVQVLHRSTRESRPPDRYGLLGLTGQLENDPMTYKKAMSDIDLDKWLDAKRGVQPVGCKWIYKHKLGADGEVTAFEAGSWQKDTLDDPGSILRKPILLKPYPSPFGFFFA